MNILECKKFLALASFIVFYLELRIENVIICDFTPESWYSIFNAGYLLRASWLFTPLYEVGRTTFPQIGYIYLLSVTKCAVLGKIGHTYESHCISETTRPDTSAE